MEPGEGRMGTVGFGVLVTNPKKKSGCLSALVALVGALIGFWAGPIIYMIWKDRPAPDPFSPEGVAKFYGIIGSIVGTVIGTLVGAAIGWLSQKSRSKYG